jgi:hypothetical protein
MKTTSRFARVLLVTALVAGIGASTTFALPSRNAAPSDDPVEPTRITPPAPTTPPVTLPTKKQPGTPSGSTTPPSTAGAGPGGAVANPASGDQRGGPVGNGNAASPAGPGGPVGGSATATKDKGARDPVDFFRPANTVRTEYSRDEYPTSKQEQVKYTSSTASADLLASYVKYLSGNGWTQTELHENNGGPGDTHQIYGHWSEQNGDSLDLRLIDSKPGVVEITINLKRVPAHT